MLGCPLIVCALTLAPYSAAIAETPENSLDTLLLEYFWTDDQTRSEELQRRIAGEAGINHQAITDRLAKLPLWPVLPPGPLELTYRSGKGKQRLAAIHVPRDYDPARAWPLLLVMPSGRQTPEACRQTAIELLSEAVAGFAILCPADPVGGERIPESGVADDLQALLVEARRRVRIDSDRTFLLGNDAGADAAWIAAIRYPHVFSGLIAVSGYPRLPYPEQYYPLVLEQLAGVRVLAVRPEIAEGTGSTRDQAAAAHLRLAVGLAQSRGLPVTELTIPATGDGRVSIPRKSLDEVLAHRRVRAPRDVQRWFRFPAFGRSGWARVTDFVGEVWNDDQLSIVPSAKVDRHAWITSVLQEKLGFLSATVRGQTISLQTRRCGGVDLLLREEMFDLSQPLTVIINDRKRHEGVVPVDLAVLLEEARKTWDFHDLPVARLSFRVRTDAQAD